MGLRSCGPDVSVDASRGERIALEERGVGLEIGGGGFDPAAGGGAPAVSAVGTLIVTTLRLVWVAHDRGCAVEVPFTDVAMHAVARGPPNDCVYAQLDGDASGLPPPLARAVPPADPEDETGADEPMLEVRFIPSEPARVDKLYAAMCECALLNPDPDDEDDEDDDDGGGGGGLGAGFFVNEEEVRAGAGARASMLDHYDSLLHMPSGDQLDQLLQRDPSRFEDEEEETAAMAEG